MATRSVLLGSSDAGVMVKRSDPFSSMEMNDQVNGHNGIIQDGIKASAMVRRVKGKVLTEAGVTRRPYEKTFSTAYAR